MTELNSLHSQVDHLVELGRLDQARQALSEALQREPDHPHSLFLAARIEQAAEQPAAARAAVERLLAVAPTHIPGRLLLLRLLIDAKEGAKAEQLALSLIAEMPQTAHLYALYAELMLQALQLPKARGLVDEALRLDPQDALAQVLDALLHLVHGRNRDAAVRLSSMVAQDPQAYHVALTAVTVLANQHRHAEALRLVRELLSTRPTDSDLVDLAVELRANTHWTMLPLYPAVRFGWGGAIGIWMAAGFALSAARKVLPASLIAPVAVGWLSYVVYSWVYPPLLRRWLRWRGF